MCWKKSAKIFNESFLSKWISSCCNENPSQVSKWPGDGVAVEPRDNKLMFLWCVDANQPRAIVLQHKRKQFGKILPHRSVKMKNRYESNNQNNNIVKTILISINSQQLTDWDHVFPLPLSLSRKSVQINERERTAAAASTSPRSKTTTATTERSFLAEFYSPDTPVLLHRKVVQGKTQNGNSWCQTMASL